MVSFTHAIVGAEGLHARPATFIAAAAMRYKSKVTVGSGAVLAAADDPIALMRLRAQRGDVLEVRAEGPDEQEAVEALRAVFTF